MNDLACAASRSPRIFATGFLSAALNPKPGLFVLAVAGLTVGAGLSFVAAGLSVAAMKQR